MKTTPEEWAAEMLETWADGIDDPLSPGEWEDLRQKAVASFILAVDQAYKRGLAAALPEPIKQQASHRHVNNGVDDACKECGEDLRNEIHPRVKL